MRKRPIIIALAVAGIVAGTHAGIAAINTESTENAAEPMASQTPVTEAQVTATETQAPVIEAQAPADNATPTEQARAQPEMFRPAVETAQMDEKYVRIPFTNKRVKMTGTSTFPSSGVEHAEPLPAVLAYLDRKNANIALAGARGSVFPSEGIEHAEPLPAVVAYFDRMESQRLAATQPAPTTVAAATPQTSSGN